MTQYTNLFIPDGAGERVALPGIETTIKVTSASTGGAFAGLDHGVGHSLLLLYDAKTPRGQKIKEFNGLGDDPFNASTSLF